MLKQYRTFHLDPASHGWSDFALALRSSAFWSEAPRRDRKPKTLTPGERKAAQAKPGSLPAKWRLARMRKSLLVELARERGIDFSYRADTGSHAGRHHPQAFTKAMVIKAIEASRGGEA